MGGRWVRSVAVWAVATALIVAGVNLAIEQVARDVTLSRPASLDPTEVGEQLRERTRAAEVSEPSTDPSPTTGPGAPPTGPPDPRDPAVPEPGRGDAEPPATSGAGPASDGGGADGDPTRG